MKFMSKLKAVVTLALLQVPELLFLAEIDVSWAIAFGCSMIAGVLGGLVASSRKTPVATFFNERPKGPCANIEVAVPEAPAETDAMPVEELVER
jgi:hypothetical protein